MEMDAASNNGVDDVRALRDEIVYSPVSCKYRVYIIDEVHMLSNSAFNALLKTIEEPPAHVVFILATTENHKVPATILSRCQRFEFHRIDNSQSAERLIRIAETENITLDMNAALLISRISDGGMRDALSLLDTCASVNPRVTAEVVRECAGIAGKEHLFQISEAVLNQNAGQALKIIDALHKRSKDMARLVDELIYHFRDLMLLKVMPDDNSVLVFTEQDESDYKTLCNKLSIEQIMRIMHILENCFENMSRSKERRLLAELCIIELCTPKLDTNETALLLRIDEIERKLTSGIIEKQVTTKKEPDLFPVTEGKGTAENKDVHTEEQNMNVVVEEKHEQPLVADDNIIDDIFPSPPPIKNNREYIVQEVIPSDKKTIPKQLQETVINHGTAISKENEYHDWNDVLNRLPPFISGMLDGTEALINGDTVIISGNELVKGIITNPDNYALILKEVNNVSGHLEKKLKISFNEQKTEKAEKRNKLQDFFDLLVQEGVEIRKK